MKCELCLKEFSSLSNLTKHFQFCKNIGEYTLKDYYDSFLTQNPSPKCHCGNDVPFRSIASGYQKYCSVSCCNKDPERKERIKNTNIKKYGGPAPMCDPLIFKKSQDTLMINWKVSSPMKNLEIKTKHDITVRDHFNCNNVSQSEEIKNLKKDKSRSAYGTDFVFQSEVVKNKIRDTNIKRHGKSNPMQCDLIVSKMKNTTHKNFYNFLVTSDRLGNSAPLFSEFEYVGDMYHEYKFKCKKCGNEFIDRIDCGKEPRCLKCNPINYMGMENEIFDFISSIYSGPVIRSTYKIIPPKQIDMYFPDKKIAIEFNGLYWHSITALPDKKYHINKSNGCLEKGIFLVQIFEDEWIFKKEIVCSRLKNLFGINTENRIYGRDCTIKEISNDDKNAFLIKNHIQGSDISSIRLGAFYNEELVSVMTFSKSSISKGGVADELTWELNRFCSKLDTSVIGVASKLLKYFTKNFEWTNIFSYADRRWSNGNLYQKLGFSSDGETGPNYWYISGSKRYHRFNFRKDVLKSKLKIYDENLSESELMILNKFDKIYDCGSYKFIMTKKLSDNPIIQNKI